MIIINANYDVTFFSYFPNAHHLFTLARVSEYRLRDSTPTDYLSFYGKPSFGHKGLSEGVSLRI